MHYVSTNSKLPAGPGKLNFYLVKSIIVGALGGLLFGFDTAVIAGTTQQLTTVFHLSPSQLGWTVSIALVGTIIGAMSSGILGDHVGGRESLRILALFYVISALGCAFAWNWPSLLIFRFIGGLGIGGSSVLGPVYIAEIAPARWRGLLVGSFQINIVIGILVAYLSNYLIGLGNFGLNEWRWQLGVAAFPALLFLIMLFGIPRSARWLVTKNRVPEAREVLDRLGSPDGASELDDIIASIHVDGVAHSEPLFQRKYRRPIYLAFTVAAFNQLAGINAILYYLNYIFAMAGFNKVSGDLQAVAVGAMNLVATLIGMSLIDKLGRKTLLMIGGFGMTFCLAGVATIFFTHSHQNMLVWFLVAYIAFFAISQGAVIWVYISEVFPNRVRSKGQALGSSTHWIMNALIAFIFPVFVQRFGGAFPFVFFAAMMALMFFVVMFTFPETKGVTLEEMQHKLGIEY
ncbi:MAG TPA: sugar porter family MFS transporter [Candidatus Eisenbacteria bacterium]|nr:sugar porter family MFS transporter [Candidatus Eisenbacteria bacterium]